MFVVTLILVCSGIFFPYSSDAANPKPKRVFLQVRKALCVVLPLLVARVFGFFQGLIFPFFLGLKALMIIPGFETIASYSPSVFRSSVSEEKGVLGSFKWENCVSNGELKN